MKTLLQIQSSIFLDNGQSSQLAERFVTAWRGLNPGGKVIVRDVAKEPVPHLDAMRFGAFLKAYFDHIARAGVTFRYTEKGPVGLLTGKKVYVHINALLEPELAAA